MKQMLKILSKLVMISLIAAIAVGGTTSCTSKKKLAAEQAAAAYAKKLDQAKTDLNAIINGTSGWTLDQQSERLAEIKAENFDDPEIQKLVSQAEKEINFQREEAERKAEEE